jgi:hypothetical protein
MAAWKANAMAVRSVVPKAGRWVVYLAVQTATTTGIYWDAWKAG